MFDHGKKNGSFAKYKSFSNDSILLIKSYEYVQDSLTKTEDKLAKHEEKRKDTTGEIESEYPGGLKAWANYLKRKLVYPERAVNNNIQCTVKVEFIVSKEGLVMDAFLLISV